MHNMLTCNKKGVRNGFPLRIEGVRAEGAAQDGGGGGGGAGAGAGAGAGGGAAHPEVEIQEAEFSAEFLQHVVHKLHWPALRAAAQQLGPEHSVALPDTVTPALLEDDAFLRTLHRVLLETVVLSAHLVCPESGRRFLVTDGIPNMLLAEDETPTS